MNAAYGCCCFCALQWTFRSETNTLNLKQYNTYSYSICALPCLFSFFFFTLIAFGLSSLSSVHNTYHTPFTPRAPTTIFSLLLFDCKNCERIMPLALPWDTDRCYLCLITELTKCVFFLLLFSMPISVYRGELSSKISIYQVRGYVIIFHVELLQAFLSNNLISGHAIWQLE